MLDILEYRHDWAQFNMTVEIFKYFFKSFLPEVIVHSKSQDEEQVSFLHSLLRRSYATHSPGTLLIILDMLQVRDHYDR